MPDWSNATGLQVAMIQDALLSAFPTPQDFETFLFLRLNQNYAQLAGHGANYRNGITQALVQARAENWLDALIAAAQVDKPRNPRVKALQHLGNLTSAPPIGGRTLEDIVRKDGGFQDVIPWVRDLDQLTGQICRVEYPVNQGVGTAWLVANDLLLTNGHVAAPIISGARKASEYVCRFDYATDANGTNKGVTFELAEKPCLAASPASPQELGVGTAGPTLEYLDYALLRLNQKVGDTPGPTGRKRGWIRTARSTPLPDSGTIVIVLQHPSGNPLKLDLGVVLGQNENGTRLKHNATTLSGSSGSPCLNAKLELVALHNAGDPLYDGVHGAAKENHAVPIELVLAGINGTAAPKFWT